MGAWWKDWWTDEGLVVGLLDRWRLSGESGGKMDNEGELALRVNLKPHIDGLLLEQGYHRAVFLPLVWDTLPTPSLFINALKRKGGWPEDYWSREIVIHTFTTEVIE